MGIRRLLDIYLLGRHRLKCLPLLPLGTSLAEAVELYGEPFESKPMEDAPEITQHHFGVGVYHEVVVEEFDGLIQSIVYWSEKADPPRDLDYVLEGYREDSDWRAWEKGYWYLREDGVVKLWCSAVPAIGVGYCDFLGTQAKLKTTHRVARHHELEDVTWAPNDVVFELQRAYVEDNNFALIEFAKRSDFIVASQDGHYVVIVRRHHAFEGPDGFSEWNKPPESPTAQSTQVVNCFRYRDGRSSWSKAALPRDAAVERLQIEGARISLEIAQTTGHRRITFHDSAERVWSQLSKASGNGPHRDEDLWNALAIVAGEHES